MQLCYWSIDKLPGLNQSEQDLLKNCGIDTTKDLLAKVHTPQAKQAFANQLQLNIKYINKWTALADLACIPSVGYEYCGLLLHSGIASIGQLTRTPFHRLHRQIMRLQVATMQRKDLCPPVEMVKQWIEEAKIIMRFSEKTQKYL
ncbi:DUF4332 domain-containing protein [Pleurocapsales cyanobacterium LEGE 06147]|nr:DUF4332 domain-containing protein [Pleurocapsales cyanobacterium LEGE 06147]